MRNLLVFLGLFAITVAVYWQVHSFEFVNFDDEGYVYENPNVLQGLRWQTFDYAFTTNDLANYHPLTWISLATDISMFGLRPGFLHLENVFIHAINAGLLFLFLIRATGNFRPALVSAALFAVHPVHVESVAWISERKDVLCGLFFLLALIAYLRYVRARTDAGKYTAYAATALLLIMGLLAKPMIVTFPLVLLLIDYWPLRRTASLPGDTKPISWMKLTLEKIPLLIFVVASSVTTFIVQRSMGAVVNLANLPVQQRVGNSALSYCRYLGNVFWPSNLSAFYPRIRELPVLAVMASILLIVAITGACFAMRKSSPYLLIGWLFFLGTMMPVIGLVQVGWQAMADRYLYLPIIGPIIMIAWSAEALIWAVERSSQLRRAADAAGVCVLIALSAVTIHQVRYWHDTQRLFQHALDVNPQNALAHVQLGYLEACQAHLDNATRHYKAAIAIDPSYFVTEFDLANLLLRNHRPDQAITYYQQAAGNQPGVAKIQNNWGVALVELNRPGEAFEHFQAAENSDPEFADAHLNLGKLFLRAGKLNTAKVEFEAALAIDPENTAAKNGLMETQSAVSGLRRQ